MALLTKFPSYLFSLTQLLICLGHISIELGCLEVAVVQGVPSPRCIPHGTRDLHQPVPQEEGEDKEPPCIRCCGEQGREVLSIEIRSCDTEGNG